MTSPVPAALVEAAIALARERGCDVAAVPLDQIARRAGISRVTLYRRIGSRRALEDAVRAAGVEPGDRPEVRDRAVTAAAAIVRERGLAALRLADVAARAQCSVAALHTQLGGREGLIAANFERYSPLPELEQALATPPAGFADGVRVVYRAILERVPGESALIQALVADALARPNGPTARHLRTNYLPRVLAGVGRWLTQEVAAGRCRPLPLPILMHLLVGPVFVSALVGGGLGQGLAEVEAQPNDETVRQLAEAFCRAVALPSDHAQEVMA